MTGNKVVKELRPMGFYLLKALPFHKLNNETITRGVFLIILFINMVQIILFRDPAEAGAVYIVSSIIATLVSQFFISMYLLAYLKDLKGERYTVKECSALIVKNVFRIAAATVLQLVNTIINAALYTAKGKDLEFVIMLISVLVIPILVLCIMLIFTNCFVLDAKAGIAEAYRESSYVTFGRKRRIFNILLIFNIMSTLVTIMAQGFDSAIKNPLVLDFIIIFISIIAELILQRLIALMYVDLRYGYKKDEDAEML